MKILLVDPHPLVRRGYLSLLGEGLPQAQLSEAESGEQALQRVQDSLPHLILSDIDLPGISGLETMRRLRLRLPQLRVLFVSGRTELSLVRQALDMGAMGYLSKGAALDVLLQAVTRISAGQPYIEQALATSLACNQRQGDAQDPRVARLTQREYEIFVMLARGLPARQVAQSLCISQKTLSNYQTLLKNKLQIGSQAELVHLAIDAGVLRLNLESA